MSLLKQHGKLETNVLLLVVGIFLTICIGGIVEIVPLFSISSTIEDVKGIRPYSPLELAGRNIYIREGCYVCHSQMIRPFRDETERYGHYSLAAESKYDHPFQWGSKRIGPDLARVGGRYSNDWHVRHLINPRDVVPESIMPGFPFLAITPLDASEIVPDMKTMEFVGVPYDSTDTDHGGIPDATANALADMVAQMEPAANQAATDAFLKRYPKAKLGPFDSRPNKVAPVTELDALLAYLQVLGTMVDFTDFDPGKAHAYR
jgi:cytochrome c oxidase cbb3-type subunit 2